ncbi:MAG: hypothetical protein HMLKMBBP_03642 [Planctomycetes bacterium]|nr:hypothetical protein [Planctomycetota bacterium]
MGFLDKFRSAFTGGAVTAAPEPMGPLQLMAGDGVGFYRERFGVTGVRILEGDGGTAYQYVLRDRSSQRAVLCAWADGSYSLQRVVAAEVDWNADVLRNVGDAPFHLVRRGQFRVSSRGDAATAGARTSSVRHYEDPAAERSVTLEDFGGYREVRVGEPVLEPELDIVRAGDAHAERAHHETDERDAAEVVAESGARAAARGSAMAAALALSGQHAEDLAPVRADARRASPSASRADEEADADPTAYDDERWADEKDPSATAEGGRETDADGIQDFAESEEDEWLAAAQYAREHPEEVR